MKKYKLEKLRLESWERPVKPLILAGHPDIDFLKQPPISTFRGYDNYHNEVTLIVKGIIPNIVGNEIPEDYKTLYDTDVEFNKNILK